MNSRSEGFCCLKIAGNCLFTTRQLQLSCQLLVILDSKRHHPRDTIQFQTILTTITVPLVPTSRRYANPSLTFTTTIMLASALLIALLVVFTVRSHYPLTLFTSTKLINNPSSLSSTSVANPLPPPFTVLPTQSPAPVQLTSSSSSAAAGTPQKCSACSPPSPAHATRTGPT